MLLVVWKLKWLFEHLLSWGKAFCKVFVGLLKVEYHSFNLVLILFFPRQRFSKEEIPELRSAIGELEAAWDRKWMDTLKDTPLVSFLNEDPVSGPMAFWALLLVSAFYLEETKIIGLSVLDNPIAVLTCFVTS